MANRQLQRKVTMLLKTKKGNSNDRGEGNSFSRDIEEFWSPFGS